MKGLEFNLKGEWQTRRVWLNGRELLPGPSQKIWNHLGPPLRNPDAFIFNWGHSGGAGAAQLALAILLKLCPKEIALFHYGRFKKKVIARLPQADFEEQLIFCDSGIISKA